MVQKMIVKKEVAEDILQKYRPYNYENLDMGIQKVIDEVIKLDIEKEFNPDTPFTYELIEFDNQNGTHIERLQISQRFNRKSDDVRKSF